MHCGTPNYLLSNSKEHFPQIIISTKSLLYEFQKHCRGASSHCPLFQNHCSRTIPTIYQSSNYLEMFLSRPNCTLVFKIVMNPIYHTFLLANNGVSCIWLCCLWLILEEGQVKKTIPLTSQKNVRPVRLALNFLDP